MLSPVGMDLDLTRKLIYFADTENNRVRVITKSTGIISTVAGNGAARYTGDKGPATLATLYYPFDVALDVQSGALYIADSGNSAIRKVNISSGIITTVAGTGTAGYGGDGGPATLAKLNSPYGVAFYSSSRTLYISDNGNCVIRSLAVDSGLISELVSIGYCGGSGYYGSTSSDYGGIAVSPSTGNVYFTVTTENSVQMVNVSTKTVYPVAGSGFSSGYSGDGGLGIKALLNNPLSVAVHATTGDIYIADSGNNVIRMVTQSTGIITTVAGTGTSGYSGDGVKATESDLYLPYGVAVDSITGMVYISDTFNYRIRAVDGIISSTDTLPTAPRKYNQFL